MEPTQKDVFAGIAKFPPADVNATVVNFSRDKNDVVT